MSNAITIALFIFQSADTHMAKARMLSWGWYDVVHLWSPHFFTAWIHLSLHRMNLWTGDFSKSYSNNKWGKLGQLNFSPKCPNLFIKRRAGTCIADVGMMWLIKSLHLFCGHICCTFYSWMMMLEQRQLTLSPSVLIWFQIYAGA